MSLPVSTTPAPPVPEPPKPGRPFGDAFRQIASGSWLVSLLSVIVALILGGVLIALANDEVQSTMSYIFSRPSDFFSASWSVVRDAYVALFNGAVLNPGAKGGFSGAIAPFAGTLTASVPLIFAGLGLTLGFRSGLFNIGAQGQIVLGGILCGWASFALHMPAALHLPFALLAAMVGGGLWGFIPGILKAKTGANEVIVTIMLNSVAGYLLAYLLTLKSFQRPDSNNPQTPMVADSATFPLLFGQTFKVHLGFVLALIATAIVWWLLERSTLGFKMRAVGANPKAAQTAGINVNTTFIWVMVIAGALAGLAGSSQIQVQGASLTGNIAASFGFDAITVALLGRSRPLGTLLAGILFGALRSGGYLMQTRTGTPIDVVLVLQSIIVLLIAAPPLVRAIFRLPKPGSTTAATTRRQRKEAVA